MSEFRARNQALLTADLKEALKSAGMRRLVMKTSFYSFLGTAGFILLLQLIVFLMN